MAQVLVTVPSRVLLEQFAAELLGFCKVGTGYNDKIDMESRGFLAVTDSVQLLNKLKFEAAFIDEAHHPVPKGMPSCKDLFKFSATHKEEADFRYGLGQAIEQGVLCDYDLTVPVTTEGHPYICLANLLLSQAGRFRRVLAYCNSIAEAKRFLRVLKTVDLAAWHINGETSRKERERVMRQFSSELTKPVHVLVTVQVLGEGVNIPNADTCMFLEPRSSYVSIIQAIGRVLRLHASKPLAHVVLPALAVPKNPARTLPVLANSASPQSSASSDAPPNALAEVSKLESQETNVGTEVPLQEAPRPDPEPHMAEVAAMQGRGKSSAEASSTKLQAGASKDAGAQGVAPLHTPGRSEPKPTESEEGASRRLSSGLEESSAKESAGELLVPGLELRADRDGQAAREVARNRAEGTPHEAELGRSSARIGGLRNPLVKAPSSTKPMLVASQSDLVAQTGVAPVALLVPHSSDEGPPASMAALQSATDSRPGRSRLAGGMWESAAKSQQPWPPHVRPPIRAVSQNSSQMNSSSVEAVNRMGTRTPGHNLRPSVRAASDAGFLCSGCAAQLERFLGAIARSDSRFAQKDARYLQSCLWATDCRLNREISLHPLVRNLRYDLALILRQCDPWDVRLQAVEKFTMEYGRLPRQRSALPEESVLGVWLHNVGCVLRRQMLAATRMQKLLNSSCSSLRARAVDWLDPSTIFERRLGELERFVQEHGRLPRQQSSVLSSASPEAVLGAFLGRVGYLLKRQSLPAAKVQKLLNSSCRTIRARTAQWLDPDARTGFDRRVEELQRFVQLHNRMPQWNKASADEDQLIRSLVQLVKPALASSTRTKRLQRLARLGPVVANWTKARQARKTVVHSRPWKQKLSKLNDFVQTHRRLPRRKHGESGLYSWLVRQRHLLVGLPSELQTALFDSHPAIVARLRISS